MHSDLFFERINTHFNKQLPFVVYRKPNKTMVNALLQSTKALYFTDRFTEKGFVFSPFNNNEKTVLIPLENSELISCSELHTLNEAEKHQFKNLSPKASKKAHVELVKKGVDAIKEGDLKKVVLSRKETVNVSNSNPIALLKKLLSKYPSAFVYCWYHPKIGLWLGATPETLIKIEGNRFSIMALAGTQDYKGTLDVTWQDKELQEQQYVTDFILENIKASIDNINISKIETVRAGNLLHLKTKIWGNFNIRPVNLKDLLYSLHPTPAVCGLPKLDAKQFILKHEGYNREFYTGFLGELNFESVSAPRSGKRNVENRAYAVNKTSTQLYVNLRCMQMKNNDAIIYIGGGITESSNAEKEWDETVSKSLVIKSVLH